jgi:hypothetical protein
MNVKYIECSYLEEKLVTLLDGKLDMESCIALNLHIKSPH